MRRGAQRCASRVGPSASINNLRAAPYRLALGGELSSQRSCGASPTGGIHMWIVRICVTATYRGVGARPPRRGDGVALLPSGRRADDCSVFALRLRGSRAVLASAKGSRRGGGQRHAGQTLPRAQTSTGRFGNAGRSGEGGVVEVLEASEQRCRHGPTSLLCDHIFARFQVHIRDGPTHAIEATAVAAAFLRTCSSALFCRGAGRARCRQAPF